MPALIVSIDTEPDLPRRRQDVAVTFRNIPELRLLQERMPDVKLTLLVTRSVVDHAPALAELQRFRADFDCEVGAHLHPEDSPPYQAYELRRRETSLLRVPPDLRAEKLRRLVAALEASFPRPTSYRAGRWQLSPHDYAMLGEQGFLVDSSVTPYTSWHLEKGMDFSTHFGEPYHVAGRLWEVPVTIGLNCGSALARRGLLRTYLRHFSQPAKGLWFPLDRLWSLARPIRPVWFRPTYTSLQGLKRLGRQVLHTAREPVLNMMFHSNELVVGGRPFVRTQADVERIVDRIVGACTYFTQDLGVPSLTLSEYARDLQARASLATASASQ